MKSRFCVFLLVNETMLTGVGDLEVRFRLVERHSLLSLKGIVRFSKVEVCGVNFGNDPENCTVFWHSLA